MSRLLLRAVGAVVLTPAAAITSLYVTHKATKRTITFWSNVFPIYGHYRYVDLTTANAPEHERDAAFDRLHERYAPDLIRIILTMRGFYIKVGQIASTRADFMPPQFLERLEQLQDQVPPESFDYVRNTVEASLGQKLEDVFDRFDPTPLGAASIGQAHRARLRDGREVVVKVKFPEVEANFGMDMQTITAFCKLVQPEQVPFLKEVRKQFMTEFDYRREADNLQTVAANMEVFKDRVRVPRPISQLCTRDVLVMEYLPGVKLIDGLKAFFRRVAEQKGTTLQAMEAERREKLRRGIIEQGPSAATMRFYALLVQTRAAVANACVFLHNALVGWAVGHRQYVTPEMPLNLPEILTTLMDVHGHQMFHDGVFNGDPHPGNILLLEDGRLGLIDFGQVKRLSLEQRKELARLVIALADGDMEEVVRVHARMGFKTRNNSSYVSRKLAIIGFDYDDFTVTEDMNIQQFMEHLGTVDEIESGADEFVMASRVSILLRGLGLHLQYPMHTAKAWRRQAAQLLREAGEEVPHRPATPALMQGAAQAGATNGAKTIDGPPALTDADGNGHDHVRVGWAQGMLSWLPFFSSSAKHQQQQVDVQPPRAMA